MKITGKAFKFGDNIDTDAILPGRYCNMTEPAQIAPHCMEGADASFAKAVRKGDVIVVGANFGCGSSREVAPLSIKAAGVGCVVAASFARIFYRNAINTGLPILESPEAASAIEAGDSLEIDIRQGTICNVTKGRDFKARPFPPFIMEIIRAGGLVQYLKNKKGF